MAWATARPSARSRLHGHLGALAISVVLSGILWVPGASATKTVLSSFGESGTAAAQFGANAPAGAAVNLDGAGGVEAGDVYVADRGGNRIEEFHADGTFVRAFGLDVGGTGVDVCTDSCVAGTSGAAAGALTQPWGVAVDQATGAVYVSGLIDHRVDVFSALGEFEGAFGFGVISNTQAELQFCTGVTGCAKGLAGAAAGQLGSIQGFLAVAPAGSPAAGDVFVADYTDARIAQYTPTISEGRVIGATFDKAFGGGVADGSSSGLQTCTTTCFKGTTGSAPGQFAANAILGIAVDAAGDVYAVDAPGNCANTCRVEKFDPTATTATDFAPDILSFTSGTPQAQAAFNVAIDPATQDVLVAQATAGETRIPRFDPGGEPIDVSAEGSGIPAPANATTAPGLAPGADGDLYLASPAAARVYLLNTPPSPAATISPVTEVGSSGATFNGTVTPVDGVDTRYRFEYSTNGIDWTQAPVPDADAGRGPGAVEVHHSARELTPNTSYQVRLRADNRNGTPAVSAPTAFTTGAAAPTVLQEVATSVGTDAAVLSAYVNPENSPTTYRFEWGPTSAYGKLAPVEFTPFIGSGARPLRVEAEIGGLRPGTTYHFRLLATSPAGRTEGVDSPFETPPAACPNEGVRAQSSQDPQTGMPFSVGLPECRAYEAVTPAEKGGVDVQLNDGPVGADGNSIGFYTIGATSDPANFSGAQSNPFLARRGPSGWTNSSSFAPAGLLASTFGAGSGAAIYSTDLGSVAMCGSPTPSASLPGESVACALARPGGPWAGGPTFPNLVDQVRPTLVLQNYFGASADLSHVVFQTTNSEVHLLPGDVSANPTGCPSARGSIYELVGLGTASPVLRLVDVDSGGDLIGPTGCAYLGSSAGGNASGGSDYQAVSADGQTIYFTATPTGGKPTLYARTGAFAGGTPAAPVTVAVSDPSPGECRSCSSAGGLPTTSLGYINGFLGASADGSKSLFLTTQQLSDADTDSTADLYSYDFDEPAGHHIIQVSAGGPDAPSPGAGAEVLGVVAISPDASHVYFAAHGVLTARSNAAGEAPRPGADNLYCWDRDTTDPRGETRFLATVPASDSSLWEAEAFEMAEAQTTLDGRYLLFATSARLAPNDTDEAKDIYRYDSLTGALLLVSTGTARLPASIGPFPSLNVFGAQPDVNSLTRAISADGSRVVFSTAEALVPADTNAAADVYEWHDGTVALISDGHDPAGADPRGAALTGLSAPTISPSGSDIFFTTRARLVGTDTDSLADIYDARVGGGFPYAAPTSCGSAEACQGPAGQAPTSGVVASSTWSGPGNPPVLKPKRHRKKHHRHDKHHKKRHHRKHTSHAKKSDAEKRRRHAKSNQEEGK